MSSFPDCQVCHQQFSRQGPAPFLLPCLHAVYETCLTSADGGVISCTTCERDVNLTETPLQKDEAREREILHLTLQRHPELVLCTNENDGNQAVCWCQDCEDFLCENCQMVHGSLKATRKHVVTDVGEMELGQLGEVKYCTVHHRYVLDTWDESCYSIICAKCKVADHAAHKTLDVDEAVQTARHQTLSYLKETRSTADHHKARLTATEQDLTSLEDSCNVMTGSIVHTFSTLRTLIDQREKELQISLQGYKEKARGELTDKKNVSEACHQRCHNTADYIDKVLQYSSPHNILELRPWLEGKWQDCRSSVPSEDYRVYLYLSSILMDRRRSNIPWHVSVMYQRRVYSSITSKMLYEWLPPDLDIAESGAQTEEGVVEELAAVLKELEKLKETDIQHNNQKKDLATQIEKLKRELKESKASEDRLGKQKKEAEKDLEAQVEKLKKEVKQLKASQERLLRQKRDVEKVSGLYRLKPGVLDQSVLLSCTHMEFSKTKYNSKKVHINTDGKLINKGEDDPPYSYRRLKKYEGTSSTVLLPQCGSPQYFEVESQVGIEETLTGEDLLLEIGLVREEEQDQHHCIDGRPHSHCLQLAHCTTHSSICRRVCRHDTSLAREEEQDQHHSIGEQPHSYSLTVAHCTTHSSICRRVWRHGKYLTCLSDTLENTPGTSATLHYGVVFDNSRSRIVFLELEKKKIIGKIDNVDSSVALWPMFGVYNPYLATVSMSLVVGGDINMWESKKALIVDSLS